MILREVDAATLHLDEKAILDYMGIHDGTPDEMTRKMIGQMRNLLQSAARPKYCYRIVREIDFHYGKIIADVYLDDRGICFRGRWDSWLIREILDFEPWQEQQKKEIEQLAAFNDTGNSIWERGCERRIKSECVM